MSPDLNSLFHAPGVSLTLYLPRGCLVNLFVPLSVCVLVHAYVLLCLLYKLCVSVPNKALCSALVKQYRKHLMGNELGTLQKSLTEF